jgi:katanin p60 ATPase-containing subunit A1
MVDLSKSLGALLAGAVERADAHRAAGRHSEAAVAWDEAARLALKLAEFSTASRDRRRRLEVADSLHQRAKESRSLATRLATPSDNARQSPGPSVTAVAEADGDADSLESQVRSLVHRSTITWGEIAGLDDTKRMIQTAYALSLARSPQGVELKSTRSLLLFGPPGCGKTLLAAATSNSLDATFFSVQAGSLLSKWYGESPRLVSSLYRVARREAPSVVFFDELDALAQNRDGTDSHAGRQILGNLLSELDGVTAKDSGPYLFSIAATNAPWDLDPAILSRFARKVYVPLPDTEARRQILNQHLVDRGVECHFSLAELVAATEGMTGRELEQLAAILVERMIWDQNPCLPLIATQGREALERYEISVRTLEQRDVDEALRHILPRTSTELLHRYDKWHRHCLV